MLFSACPLSWQTPLLLLLPLPFPQHVSPDCCGHNFHHLDLLLTLSYVSCTTPTPPHNRRLAFLVAPVQPAAYFARCIEASLGSLDLRIPVPHRTPALAAALTAIERRGGSHAAPGRGGEPHGALSAGAGAVGGAGSGGGLLGFSQAGGMAADGAGGDVTPGRAGFRVPPAPRGSASGLSL